MWNLNNLLNECIAEERGGECIAGDMAYIQEYETNQKDKHFSGTRTSKKVFISHL